MPAVALAGIPRDLRPEESHPGRRPRPNDTGSGVPDLSAAVQRLAGLGVTVRCDQVALRAVAEWSADTRTVTLRSDTTVHAALRVLRDLYSLATDPGHVSPSVPVRRLRVAR